MPEVLLWGEKKERSGEGGGQRGKERRGEGKEEGEGKGGEERPMVILDTEKIMHCF